MLASYHIQCYLTVQINQPVDLILYPLAYKTCTEVTLGSLHASIGSPLIQRSTSFIQFIASYHVPDQYVKCLRYTISGNS
jgi:hypothetical protein